MRNIVLMYHDVYRISPTESGFQTSGSAPYKLNDIDFEKHLRLYKEYNANHPNEQLILTFDDGGESFYSIIGPMLKRMGFIGIFFITTSMIGTPGFCTAAQIKALYDDGHIIGSHNHVHRSSVSDMSINDILKEWTKSVEILENIICDKITIASLPNGFCNPAIFKALETIGIRKVYTSLPTTKTKEKNKIKYLGRYAITGNLSTNYINSLLTSSMARSRIAFRYKLLVILKTVFGPNYGTFKSILRNLINGKR